MLTISVQNKPQKARHHYMQTLAGTQFLQKTVLYLRNFEVNFSETGTQYNAH
jgi:hypothetical protein